ncbi:MAG: glycogen/starch/alpha-glucan phosphorylase [Sandaracinaceae bacterium]|nr:glycogen/starch/alpha-glucan phosphorylase [Sandaracinaceae bacterium]
MLRSSRPKPLHTLTKYDLGMDAESIKVSIANHVEYTLGKDEYSLTARDVMWSVARASRDRMMDRWTKTQQGYYDDDVKRVYYLSMEYLLGRLLRDGLLNLGILEETRAALKDIGVELDEIVEQEPDPGLGNGGLGRLAACFLDSMATLGLPAVGYGIRYDYGIFRQTIVDGAQVEQPDNWLAFGSPWEISRPDHLHKIKFNGRVQSRLDATGELAFDWVDTDDVIAMAHDIPVPGYRNECVNTLRLWGAKASREFELSNFNRGDYVEAVRLKNASEDISRVLYPNDQVMQGKELRLKQEYFFVSATLQDAVRRHLKVHKDLDSLPDRAVFQLNDTHPAIAIAEMMRLLLDEHHIGWERAWGIVQKSFAYTNHTLLPEALERWPVWLMERVLPRHMQIITEINRRLLVEVRAHSGGDATMAPRMSLIDDHGEKQVRMAFLAIAGSFSVNGVSALHSQLLKERMFPDFDRMMPGKFRNKTNGVTPRRWLLQCNPPLASLISEVIGDTWVTALDELSGLEKVADDAEFQKRWRAAKATNKERLGKIIARDVGVVVDTRSLFDVQVKRFHEYKRQLLNLLHVVNLYRRIKSKVDRGRTPRTVIFGGKAAPGYERAKQIIHLANDIAKVVNADPDTRDALRVVFIPNYSVSLAERIIPAADLSEQISTAGMEASGTGNMKFAMNGALTIGTLDGANIEILDAVGAENIFVFGLTAEEVQAKKESGYDPHACVEGDADLKGVLDAISSGMFSPEEPNRYLSVVSSLLERDEFMLLQDFAAYRDTQTKVDALFRDQAQWTRRAILNVARMGRFSSDATITDYATDIWGISPRVSRR